MVDVTIVGGGARARDCGEVLSRAGFSLAHSFEVETGNHSPIILGELQGAFQIARQAVQAGRHILLAGPMVLTPERLTLLFQDRRSAQGVFVWSDRRFHPGYRFVAGLMESDSSWRPRYLRQEALSTETPASSLFRWRTLESIVLMNEIAGIEPRSVKAQAIVNAKRNAPDLASLSIAYEDVETHLIVGLGEPMDRRETLVASSGRKVYVDELNPNMPVRIVDDEPVNPSSARWLSCTAPSSEERARQQCIAFLDATLHGQRTQHEAAIWTHALAALAAMERSLAEGATEDVVLREEGAKLVVIGGVRATPPSVA